MGYEFNFLSSGYQLPSTDVINHYISSKVYYYLSPTFFVGGSLGVALLSKYTFPYGRSNEIKTDPALGVESIAGIQIAEPVSFTVNLYLLSGKIPIIDQSTLLSINLNYNVGFGKRKE